MCVCVCVCVQDMLASFTFMGCSNNGGGHTPSTSSRHIFPLFPTLSPRPLDGRWPHTQLVPEENNRQYSLERSGSSCIMSPKRECSELRRRSGTAASRCRSSRRAAAPAGGTPATACRRRRPRRPRPRPSPPTPTRANEMGTANRQYSHMPGTATGNIQTAADSSAHVFPSPSSAVWEGIASRGIKATTRHAGKVRAGPRRGVGGKLNAAVATHSQALGDGDAGHP